MSDTFKRPDVERALNWLQTNGQGFEIKRENNAKMFKKVIDACNAVLTHPDTPAHVCDQLILDLYHAIEPYAEKLK